ncbi:MAG: TolC family protein [Sediminibacterium sp.]|nr:TolC family protein [Sediminibacterium sp.]
MRLGLLLLFFLFSYNCFSQKKITLKEAEQLLQKNNLQLVAEKYNISASQAAVIQAKIWNQPDLTLDINAFNPGRNQFFDIGDKGEKFVSIEQLIYLGGKKKHEINFAKSNLAIAQLEFEQLLRNLKYQLHQTFYSVYFDNQKIQSLNTQISIIDTLVNNYNAEANLENVPLREVVRLQSLVLNLKNEKNYLQNNIIEATQNLSLLTGIYENLEPVVNEAEILLKYQTALFSKDLILATALESNIEYLTTIKFSESQESYLKWQKSLAVPDITTGISYDQLAGAFLNQINVNMTISLPFWNKNKGNIKLAEAQLSQSNIKKDYKKMELKTKVEIYWQQYQQQLNQLNNIDKSTIINLELVYQGMIFNFKKRNITMLEFTDFMDSYNQSLIQINDIKKSLVLSVLNLNYITNKEIF